MNALYGPGKGIMIPQQKLEIPKINDTRLKELYHILKPIVSVENLKYYIRKFTLQELRTLTYTLNRDDNKMKRIDEKELEWVEDFLCLHSIGNFGLFQPKIAEVLSQVPEKTLEEANIFEIIDYPKTEEDMNKFPEITNHGFHLSKVRSYKLRK